MKITLKNEDGTEETIELPEYEKPSREELLKRLEEYPLFIATVNYFATGEGHMLRVVIGSAKDLEEFKEQKAKLDKSLEYYFIGADFFQNELPPHYDTAWNLLVSDNIKARIEGILEGVDERGNISIDLKYHVNYS